MAKINRGKVDAILFSTILIIVDIVLFICRLITDPNYWRKYISFVNQYPWGILNIILIIVILVIIYILSRRITRYNVSIIEKIILFTIEPVAQPQFR
jgi:hypothetical protein